MDPEQRKTEAARLAGLPQEEANNLLINAHDEQSQNPLPDKSFSYKARHREVISDPVNLLIERHPLAGTVREGCITLHNGMRIASDSYYNDMGDILIFNRGVVEPLQEFVFQEHLRQLKHIGKDRPVMLELGAYWCHYSIWFKSRFPDGFTYAVEANKAALKLGKANWKLNNLEYTAFLHQLVAENDFEVPRFMEEFNVPHIDILHADIEGFETDMLFRAFPRLADRRIGALYLSTHSEELHTMCCDMLRDFDYSIVVDSSWWDHTNSSDGFIFAQSPDVVKLDLPDPIWGRLDIAKATVEQRISYIENLFAWKKRQTP